MTYISAQPMVTTSWEDICYPVEPVWLADLLPDYDLVATDRQQLIVGHPKGGRKTVFGIQSADYLIMPNEIIRQVVDALVDDYTLQIKHTTTGEFSISVVLPESVSVGGEQLQRSLIITNSYNGKTPFSLQGQPLSTLLAIRSQLGTSLYRNVCQNGLMGWADSFADVDAYQQWLIEKPAGKEKSRSTKGQSGEQPAPNERKAVSGRLTPELFQEQLHDLIREHLEVKPALTPTIYAQMQQTVMPRKEEGLLRSLPVPVQLAKQAQERLRLEERLLEVQPSYWLLYNAVNYALFTGRSSLTLTDRYRTDERVFHQLAAHAYA